MRSSHVALLSVLLAICCQWMLVHFAYDGNWTALFCPGDRFTRPPEIRDREYVFRDSAGYDGQFYQLIAHDPLFTRHYERFVDAPRLRYRRILMPGLAWLLAGGQFWQIDWAFFAVCCGFIGLGTFCLAQLAADEGRSSLWGLLFLVTPSTLAAIERMTVDISLVALIPAALLAARRQRWILLWMALAGAMLAKETGILVILAVVVWLARQREFRRAAVLSASALPALAWYVFVQSHTGGDFTTSDFTFSAFLAYIWEPLNPGIISLVFRIATIAAAAGLIWAAVRSLILAIQDRFHDLAYLLCFVFGALLLLFQNSSLWTEPVAFTRIYSSVLVCLIAATFKRGFHQTLITSAIVAFPLALQLGVHLGGPVVRTILQH